MDSGDGDFDDDTNSDSDSDSGSGSDDTRPRGESGQFSPAVTIDDIRDYLREHRGSSTGELACHFDVSTETIRRKCHKLEEQNDARGRKGRGIFWQLTETEE